MGEGIFVSLDLSVIDLNSHIVIVQGAAADASGGYRRTTTEFERQASETAAAASAAAADTRAGRQVLPSTLLHLPSNLFRT